MFRLLNFAVRRRFAGEGGVVDVADDAALGDLRYLQKIVIDPTMPTKNHGSVAKTSPREVYPAMKLSGEHKCGFKCWSAVNAPKNNPNPTTPQQSGSRTIHFG
jgi:hypothetical protein